MASKPEAAPIHYRIRPLDRAAHLFEVHLTIQAPDPGGQRVALPAWIPGSYMIREFARHVVRIEARSRGRRVGLTKLDKHTWQARPCKGPLEVACAVYAWDLSVRAAHLDRSHGFFNGTSVFLRAVGQEDRPCTVEIAPPAGPEYARWRVATTLPRAGAPAHGFGTYRAADYDELIDHPVEMGEFSLGRFEAAGVPHEIAITGRHDADLDRLGRDLAAICETQIRMFEPRTRRAPFDRYVFLTMAVGDGYGGLEHRASTALLCSRADLPWRGMPGRPEGYRRFLGLASHEYFHSWNVKRIKPAAFVPYDLAREAYTRQLWAFEGITSYYDDLALARSGVVDAASYLELLGRTVTAVLRTPGRHVQSLADASFDAWIKYYRPDENTPNAGVSYYAKGALVALALDLELRLAGSSLDALMRELWRRHGETGVGVPEDGIARLASGLAGRDLSPFFAAYVDGTDELPLARLLASHGVTLSLRASRGAKDRGGKRAEGDAPRTSLGATFTPELRLQHVFAGGAARAAGLAAGDVLVALDGLKASAERLEACARDGRPGDRVAVHAFRRDELFETTLELAAAPEDAAWLALDADAAPDAVARRERWLG